MNARIPISDDSCERDGPPVGSETLGVQAQPEPTYSRTETKHNETRQTNKKMMKHKKKLATI